MTAPKVSVVIPVRDRVDAVSRAVDSVLAQDYPLFDIHLIENNSKDPTVVENVMREKDDLRIHVHHLVSCANANVARNYGVDASNGALIAFLDSDDEWYPTHLARAARCLGERHASFYYGSIDVWDGVDLVPQPSRQMQEREDPGDYLFLGGGSASTCSYVVNRHVFSVVRWDENLRRHQDFDFFINACRRFRSVGDPAATVRVNWLRGERRDYDVESMIQFYKKHRMGLSNAAIRRFCYEKIRFALKIRSFDLLSYFVMQYCKSVRSPLYTHGGKA